MLSDNAAIFTEAARHGVCVMESELASLDIEFKHSRREHPQTYGKSSTFTRPSSSTCAPSAGPVPFPASKRSSMTSSPTTARSARTDRWPDEPPSSPSRRRKKARPKGTGVVVPLHCRIRQDKVHTGKVTLRHRSDLYHIAVGRAYEGRRVLILVANRDVRVLTPSGELIRHLRLNPSRLYQPLGLRNRP
jgi:hypothetical protein